MIKKIIAILILTFSLNVKAEVPLPLFMQGIIQEASTYSFLRFLTQSNPQVLIGSVALSIALNPAIASDISEKNDKIQKFKESNPQASGYALYVLMMIALSTAEKSFEKYRLIGIAMNLQVPNTFHRNVSNNVKPNYIKTPYGETIDTSILFPNVPIADWEEFGLTLSSALLGSNITNKTKTKKTHGFAAHHIIPENLKKYSDCNTIRSYLNTQGFIIDINDADNGVFLPHDPIVYQQYKASGGKAVYHRTLHTAKYCEDVNNKLKANGYQTEKALRASLIMIRQELETGKF